MVVADEWEVNIMTANLPGIVNSALLTALDDPTKRVLPDMTAYEQLGAAFRQMSMMQQQIQQPQSDPTMISPSGGDDAAFAGRGGLTANFDHNWLEKAYQAGSADGATLGGGGKKGGGGQEDDMDDPHNPKRDAVTAKRYGDMPGAGRLAGGWRDFFGVGKGNKMGMGR